MTEARFEPLEFEPIPEAEMLARATSFERDLSRRRSVRHFKTDPVPRALLESVLKCAGHAPSGAHQQPWTFVVVSHPETKRRIRAAAEAEEQENYGGRMAPEWIDVLRPLGTDAHKPCLEDAPALIVVFRQAYGEAGGKKFKHYYTQESVGIAVGFLLAALHRAGLCSLTHTPSPMGFLEKILERPPAERAFVLIPVGYPTDKCEVPALDRKALDEFCVWR
ncbi:MAG: nitroreductase family protein [bacterium]|jgi:nitroreductase|nr:nitroreductase family protein [Planctomycetota bacterium]HIL52570.1 nitroreductase family protein [Planctomycetota bacterium]